MSLIALLRLHWHYYTFKFRIIALYLHYDASQIGVIMPIFAF